MRYISWTEFFIRNGRRIEKLVIQFCHILSTNCICTGNVQGMIVLETAFQICRPGQTILFHPTEALEHTLGQDHIHIFDAVPLAPDIHDHVNAQVIEQGSEIHFMDDAFDVGQANLKGMMLMPVLFQRIKFTGQSWGYQAFSIKLRDLDIHFLFHSGISSNSCIAAIILHCNGFDLGYDASGIINDDDPPIIKEPFTINPTAAGKEQAVIGVEFTQLALPNGNTEHHAFFQLFIKVRPNEAEFGIAAHTGRTLEGHIGVQVALQTKLDSLRAEHPFCFSLKLRHLAHRLSIKDAGKINVDKHLR